MIVSGRQPGSHPDDRGDPETQQRFLEIVKFHWWAMDCSHKSAGCHTGNHAYKDGKRALSYQAHVLRPEAEADRQHDREERKEQRGNKTLVETLAGLESEDDGPKACLICQL